MKNQIYVVVRFELNKGEIDVLYPTIQDFFKNEVAKAPGFIGAKLHRNEEGTVLINYATWESVEIYKKFIVDVAMHSEISKKIQRFASKADIVFEIPL